ncbi:hypothetical protein C8R43DRAFT_1139862 [Mycena crocata]|nr:hypothetical protein C8R43DRAFT_1139862 [Mycena crocata]
MAFQRPAGRPIIWWHLRRPRRRSNFEDLLFTNIVPSQRDCQSIRKLVVAPMKEIGNLTTKNNRLQNIVEKLTAKREGLAEFVESHLALVSSARRVPHDILAAGNIYCLSSTDIPYCTNESPLYSFPTTPLSVAPLIDCLRLFPMLERLLLHRDKDDAQNNGPSRLSALLTPPVHDPISVVCPQLHDICRLGVDAGADQELLTLVQTRSTGAIT